MDGSVTGGLLKKKGYCSFCIKEKNKCSGGSIKTRTGVVSRINCDKCKKHKILKVHQQCSSPHDGISGIPRVPQPRGLSSNFGSDGPGVAFPPVTTVSTLPAASVSELRSTVTSYTVSNPNALGSASDVVDICILEGPDRKQRKVRVIYDSGASDTVVDFKIVSYYHSLERVEYTSRGVDTNWNYSTHISTLMSLRQYGSYNRIKALKGELSSPAFTLISRRRQLMFLTSLRLGLLDQICSQSTVWVTSK